MTAAVAARAAVSMDCSAAERQVR